MKKKSKCIVSSNNVKPKKRKSADNTTKIIVDVLEEGSAQKEKEILPSQSKNAKKQFKKFIVMLGSLAAIISTFILLSEKVYNLWKWVNQETAIINQVEKIRLGMPKMKIEQLFGVPTKEKPFGKAYVHSYYDMGKYALEAYYEYNSLVCYFIILLDDQVKLPITVTGFEEEVIGTVKLGELSYEDIEALVSHPIYFNLKKMKEPNIFITTATQSDDFFKTSVQYVSSERIDKNSVKIPIILSNDFSIINSLDGSTIPDGGKYYSLYRISRSPSSAPYRYYGELYRIYSPFSPYQFIFTGNTFYGSDPSTDTRDVKFWQYGNNLLLNANIFGVQELRHKYYSEGKSDIPYENEYRNAYFYSDEYRNSLAQWKNHPTIKNGRNKLKPNFWGMMLEISSDDLFKEVMYSAPGNQIF